jgi:hypothetical protein
MSNGVATSNATIGSAPAAQQMMSMLIDRSNGVSGVKDANAFQKKN